MAVSTWATDEDVVLEGELMEVWTLAESTLWASLYPDPVATYQREVAWIWTKPRPQKWLGGSGSERAAPPEPADHTPGPDSTAEAAQWPSGTWISGTNDIAFTDFVEELLHYEVEGRTLQITIPLAYLGDPETLSLGQVRLVDLDHHTTEGDYFPNDQDACVPVPLPGGPLNG